MAEHSRPDLGSVLRHEAERHVPDRDAMLTRIVQRRAEPARRRWLFTSLRPVAAAASVVATLVVGVTGIRLLGGDPEPDRAPAATEGSPSTSVTLSPSPSVSSRAPREKQTADAGPEKPPERKRASRQPVDGFLSSGAVVDAHSVGTWAQGNVTLTTTREITALDVVINVARTAGVTDAGKWTTIPTDMVDTVVTAEKDRLTYRFTLKRGTLAPGGYVFAVQYLHAEGERDPSADVYGAVATAGGKQATVSGVFTKK